MSDLHLSIQHAEITLDAKGKRGVLVLTDPALGEPVMLPLKRGKATAPLRQLVADELARRAAEASARQAAEAAAAREAAEVAAREQAERQAAEAARQAARDAEERAAREAAEAEERRLAEERAAAEAAEAAELRRVEEERVAAERAALDAQLAQQQREQAERAAAIAAQQSEEEQARRAAAEAEAAALVERAAAERAEAARRAANQEVEITEQISQLTFKQFLQDIGYSTYQVHQAVLAPDFHQRDTIVQALVDWVHSKSDAVTTVDLGVDMVQWGEERDRMQEALKTAGAFPTGYRVVLIDMPKDPTESGMNAIIDLLTHGRRIGLRVIIAVQRDSFEVARLPEALGLCTVIMTGGLLTEDYAKFLDATDTGAEQIIAQMDDTQVAYRDQARVVHRAQVVVNQEVRRVVTKAEYDRIQAAQTSTPIADEVARKLQ